MKKIILSLCILSSLGFTGCLGKSEIEKENAKIEKLKEVDSEYTNQNKKANLLNGEW
ncbi:MAG: hypothetical protein ACRCZO_11465 [Cetobacterium sp.]|jgi:hypothetical protein|uniref:hypothetical protein n=1 Tax=unclassified Cetobacterium TaxID=2630983 RepID=UPI0012E06CDB|nr:hypothetical protein [Cetobacterium sp. ZOR0034]